MSRFSTAARFTVVALLVGFGYTVLLSGSALAAGPDVWETYNTTHPVVSFIDCNAKAQQALRAMGLTVAGHPDFTGRENSWFGRSDKTTTVIVCYPLGNGGSVQVFFAAANAGSGVALGAFQTQLLQNFYGTGVAGGCSSPVGTWNWWNGGSVTFTVDGVTKHSNGHTGKWLRLPDGSYYVHWDYPTDDYFTISPDGKTMQANLNGHTGFNGQAGTSTRSTSC